MHTYIYISDIMTKVISISDDAYYALTELKEGKDSFSKVVLRIVKKVKKVSILEFTGKWKGSKDELDKLFLEIKEERKKTKLRTDGI